MVDKISKMRKIAMSLSEELGREPTDEELSAETGIPREKISAVKTVAMRPASLDAPVGPEDDTEF
jgi:RNA polymerase primary sigma factor